MSRLPRALDRATDCLVTRGRVAAVTRREAVGVAAGVHEVREVLHFLVKGHDVVLWCLHRSKAHRCDGRPLIDDELDLQDADLAGGGAPVRDVSPGPVVRSLLLVLVLGCWDRFGFGSGCQGLLPRRHCSADADAVQQRAQGGEPVGGWRHASRHSWGVLLCCRPWCCRSVLLYCTVLALNSATEAEWDVGVKTEDQTC